MRKRRNFNTYAIELRVFTTPIHQTYAWDLLLLWAHNLSLIIANPLHDKTCLYVILTQAPDVISRQNCDFCGTMTSILLLLICPTTHSGPLFVAIVSKKSDVHLDELPYFTCLLLDMFRSVVMMWDSQWVYKACHPGEHCWDYYPGALFLNKSDRLNWRSGVFVDFFSSPGPNGLTIWLIPSIRRLWIGDTTGAGHYCHKEIYD